MCKHANISTSYVDNILISYTTYAVYTMLEHINVITKNTDILKNLQQVTSYKIPDN